MRLRVIVQCRVSSTRLPAKAFLPVCGMPSVLLCVRRAANTGLDVRVATSSHSTDDTLSKLLQAAGIPCFRGPLEDVRARFFQATADLENDDRIVRLTADNLFPDGAFIEELVAEAQSRALPYFGSSSPFDGLPYGMSAETFTVGALRQVATIGDSSSYEREHVTPALRSASAAPFRPRGMSADLSHLRCTLDTFEDYQRLLRVFESVRDPVTASWHELCERLAMLQDAPRFRIPYRKKSGRIVGIMAVGTAQLGLSRYGVANKSGRPDRTTAASMIREAVAHGVTDIDSARAYGDAEAIVGEAMEQLPREHIRVVTKLDPLADVPADASYVTISKAVEASVLRSCRELRTRCLDTLLLHRWSHRSLRGGIVWTTLKRLQAEGLIDRLGASVYTPVEAAEALNDPDIRHLQLPFSVLDWRWRAAGIPELVTQRPDVIVHARSILLQGILVGSSAVWPRIAGVDPDQWIRRLENAAAEVGRANRGDLCFAYVAAQPWIHAFVVGAETPGQMMDNLQRCLQPCLTETECERVESLLAGAPEHLLNPGLWKTKVA